MCKAENWTETAFICIQPWVILSTLPLNFMIPNVGSTYWESSDYLERVYTTPLHSAIGFVLNFLLLNVTL